MGTAKAYATMGTIHGCATNMLMTSGNRICWMQGARAFLFSVPEGRPNSFSGYHHCGVFCSEICASQPSCIFMSHLFILYNIVMKEDILDDIDVVFQEQQSLEI